MTQGSGTANSQRVLSLTCSSLVYDLNVWRLFMLGFYDKVSIVEVES